MRYELNAAEKAVVGLTSKDENLWGVNVLQRLYKHPACMLHSPGACLCLCSPHIKDTACSGALPGDDTSGHVHWLQLLRASCRAMWPTSRIAGERSRSDTTCVGRWPRQLWIAAGGGGAALQVWAEPSVGEHGLQRGPEPQAPAALTHHSWQLGLRHRTPLGTEQLLTLPT